MLGLYHMQLSLVWNPVLVRSAAVQLHLQSHVGVIGLSDLFCVNQTER